MNGVSHVKSIFDQYSVYTLSETPGGTPVCVFTNPSGSPTMYAGGNGFVMSGGTPPLAYDYTGLQRFLERTEPMFDIPPANLKVWKEARDKLRRAVCKKSVRGQRLSA